MSPALRQLPEIAAGLQKTLTNANRLVQSVDTGYGDNTKFNRDLERLLVQLNEAMSSIRALADLLARHPEALIKGRPTGGVAMTGARRLGGWRCWPQWRCPWPPARRQTRRSTRSRPWTGSARTGAPKVILLQQIGLARYLERSQIVRSSENYRLDVMPNDWWGEPLGAMLSRVLIEELGQRLPQSVVISENGAVSSPADATIELNLQRLDEDAAGNLVLQAQAAVSFKGRHAPVLRSFRFAVTPQAPGVPAEVAAISAAVGQLADGLASMLLAGPAAR